MFCYVFSYRIISEVAKTGDKQGNRGQEIHAQTKQLNKYKTFQNRYVDFTYFISLSDSIHDNKQLQVFIARTLLRHDPRHTFSSNKPVCSSTICKSADVK